MCFLFCFFFVFLFFVFPNQGSLHPHFIQWCYIYFKTSAFLFLGLTSTVKRGLFWTTYRNMGLIDGLPLICGQQSAGTSAQNSTRQNKSIGYKHPSVYTMQQFSSKENNHRYSQASDPNHHSQQITSLSLLLNIMFLHRWEDFSQN